MLWILLLVAVVSAETVTQYSVNYGSYSVPANMTEDDSGTRIVFSSSSERSRMDDIVVDYNARMVILKSSRRQECSVVDLNTEIKNLVDNFKQQIHETHMMKSLYFKFSSTKPSDHTTVQQQLVTDICTDYRVRYQELVSASTTPPRKRHGCYGLSWGNWCLTTAQRSG